MAESTTIAPPDRGSRTETSGRRRIRRARGLPGGRAVVGALLVAGAAVGVFGAYLNATAEPTTTYLVANRSIEPGTRFATIDDVAAALSGVAVDLHPEIAARAIPIEEADGLVGTVLISPFEPGDLLHRTDIVRDGGVPEAQTLSFSLPASDAVAGTLRAGERIDVLATYGQGDTAYTAYVVRGVPVIRVAGGAGGGIGGGGEDVSLTVAVTSLADVQALGHAVNTASVFVTRSAAEGETPGAYQPSRDDAGPAPDPAADPVGVADDAPQAPDPDQAEIDPGAADPDTETPADDPDPETPADDPEQDPNDQADADDGDEG